MIEHAQAGTALIVAVILAVVALALRLFFPKDDTLPLDTETAMPKTAPKNTFAPLNAADLRYLASRAEDEGAYIVGTVQAARLRLLAEELEERNEHNTRVIEYALEMEEKLSLEREHLQAAHRVIADMAAEIEEGAAEVVIVFRYVPGPTADAISPELGQEVAAILASIRA